MAAGIPARLTPAEGRKFGMTVGIAFLVLAGVLWWRDHLMIRNVLAALGGTLVLAGLVIPSRLGPVQRGWMRLALLISKVTTPVFMAIIYYLVILPVGLIMRLVGRHPLVHGRGDSGFWHLRPEGPERRSDLNRQF